MRILSMSAGLTGLFMAGALAAQTPAPDAQTAPPAEAQPQQPAAAPAAAPAPRPQPAAVPPALEPENTWNLDLTTGGRVVIQLRPDAAPAHVERIKTLTRQGFYNGLVFHRVVEGFMAQGGDPTATGSGGSQLPDIPAEINGLPHVRGALGMARAQEMNSANSQFFIMFAPRLIMDRDYTVLGRVVSGMNFVDTIERGEPPLAPTRIVRASIGADNVPPLSAEELRAAATPPPAAIPAAPLQIPSILPAGTQPPQ